MSKNITRWGLVVFGLLGLAAMPMAAEAQMSPEVTVTPTTLTALAGEPVMFTTQTIAERYILDFSNNGGQFFQVVNGVCSDTVLAASTAFNGDYSKSEILSTSPVSFCYTNNAPGVYNIEIHSQTPNSVDNFTVTLPITILPPPSAPAVTQTDSNTVTLDWADTYNPTNATLDYTVEISAASEDFNRRWDYRQNGSTTRFTDSVASVTSPSFTGETRWFRVVPHLDGVAGTPLPPVQVDFLPPTTPTVAFAGTTTANLSWDDPAGTTPTGYVIQASANNKTFWTVSDWRVFITGVNTALVDLGPEVVGRQRYFRVVPEYRVEGETVLGTPSRASEVFTFTGTGVATPVATSTPVEVWEAPVVTVINQDTAELIWETPVGTSTLPVSYTIEASANDVNYWRVAANTITQTAATAATINFREQDGVSGKNRYFRIVPHYEDGAGTPSPASERVSFPALVTAMNLAVTNNSDGTITIDWEAPAGLSVEHYLVELAVNDFTQNDDGTNDTIIVLQSDATSITLTQIPTLADSDIWYVRVKPIYSDGTSSHPRGPASSPTERISFGS